MREIEKIYNKFNSGDSLTDKELNVALIHFRATSDLLSALGPMFKLTWIECMRVMSILEEFKIERARKY